MRKIALIGLLFLGLVLTGCQAEGSSTSTTATTATVSQEMDEHDDGHAAQIASQFPRLAAALHDFANAMPDDKYDFKPTEEVGSFADQLLHAAQGVQGIIGAAVEGDWPEVNAEASSKEEILEVIDAIFGHAEELVGGLSDEQLEQEVSLFGGQVETTVAGAIDIAVNHVTHHKGGLVVYLRLNGATPPAFGGI